MTQYPHDDTKPSMAPKDKWSAVYSVQTILLSIQSLLGGT